LKVDHDRADKPAEVAGDGDAVAIVVEKLLEVSHGRACVAEPEEREKVKADAAAVSGGGK
jgi:hypothetical protein